MLPTVANVPAAVAEVDAQALVLRAVVGVAVASVLVIVLALVVLWTAYVRVLN
jgi:hypothetical protein